MKWTENSVFKTLSRTFPPGPFVLLPSVRNGTGYAKKKTRTADGIAVSVWPSRGLYFTGIEIKVSHSDWMSEIKDPEKSCEIQKYCRYWYIATPEGVVQPGEMPENWGHIIVGEKKNVMAKEAPRLTPEPPDMLFVCSVLRAASEQCVPMAEIQDREREIHDRAFEDGKKRSEYDAMQLREAVDYFEHHAGIKIDKPWEAGKIGDAVRLVMQDGIAGIERQVREWDQELTFWSKRLGELVAKMDNG